MVPVSVVIITKNEAENIAACLEMVRLITDDILVIDNGSTDATLSIAAKYGCRIYENSWQGYGANKNKGVTLAKYDWILSVDADEVPDIDLVLSLHNLKMQDNTVYDIRFCSYFGKKRVRFGFWGRDHHIRLFNRNTVRWSEPQVHETLLIPENIRIEKLDGSLHHYSVKDEQECNHKAVYYAKLSAEKLFAMGKRVNLVNLYISPVFCFITGYIVFLGFMDGREGWNIAKTMFKNKWLKYQYLSQLEYGKKQYIEGSFAGDVSA